MDSFALAQRGTNTELALFSFLFSARREAMIATSLQNALGNDNSFGSYTCWTSHVEYTLCDKRIVMFSITEGGQQNCKDTQREDCV